MFMQRIEFPSEIAAPPAPPVSPLRTAVATVLGLVFIAVMGVVMAGWLTLVAAWFGLTGLAKGATLLRQTASYTGTAIIGR